MHTFTKVAAAFSFFLSINAAPAARPVSSYGKRDVSAGQLATLNLFEQYSAAAYCSNNFDAGSSSAITCAAGNCALVQAAGADSVAEFADQGATDATGFVAVDDVNKLIVVSIRGSQSLENWLGNLNIAFTGFSGCSGCQVHSGFNDGWNSAKPIVMAALQSAVAAHGDYAIVATGHSLGAAIATIAAADLRGQGYNVALYTYGSPMVGNDNFATYVTNQAGGNYRVTHATDPVPKLPGYILGYRHVSPEYWITTPSGQQVPANQIQVSSGILDLSGNGGTLTSNVSDHLYYFNAISACSSDSMSL